MSTEKVIPDDPASVPPEELPVPEELPPPEELLPLDELPPP